MNSREATAHAVAAGGTRLPERRVGMQFRMLLSTRIFDPLGVLMLSTAMFFAGFGGGLGRLSTPLGTGDLLPAYTQGNMWAHMSPFGNTTLGFPFGMELRYYPTTDVLQNAFAGLFGAVSGNPFLGMNMVYAASFPITALAALWVMRIVGMRGPIAIFTSLAFTAIPYHWLRLEHVYLGTMYSAALGVGLALVVGTGDLERRLVSTHRLRAVLPLLGIVIVIASSGIYYACFTILLCGAAAVYRLAQGSGWRGICLALTSVVGVGGFTALALAPAWLYVRNNPPLHAVAARYVVESVAYSGALALALLPAPVSKIPGFGPINQAIEGAYAAGSIDKTSGVIWYANAGSLFTVLALCLAAAGVIWSSRRTALARKTGIPAERVASGGMTVDFSLLGTLLVTALFFFIPWGLNFLFAYAVTPQLRGWDRLIPVLFLLVFSAAAVAWRRFGLPLRGARAVGISVVCLVVLVFDSVLPYRSNFTSATVAGLSNSDPGYAYATALNAAVPGDCGVLELPYVGYAEVASVVAMGNYDPIWPALTNPVKRWSFGAIKGTVASAWQEVLGNNINASVIDNLKAGGFCAIHVDRRGYSLADGEHMVAVLTTLLGPPVAVAHDKNWLAFALQRSTLAKPIELENFSRVSDELQTFYAPPAIVAGTSAPHVPVEPDAFRKMWWLPPEPATFNFRSIVEKADFNQVAGSLLAADCSAKVVLVSLRSGVQTVSTKVSLQPGQATVFALKLRHATTAAQLSISAQGKACTVPESLTPVSVALVNPIAEFAG